MKKMNEKKVVVLSFLGVLTFIAVVIGATYAYFAAQGGNSANTNVNVQTSTTDNLSFQVGSAISLTANQEDFGQGTGNKSGSTFARATLTANNATNNATRNYYVYLDITSNDFEYTTEDSQGEILLKVTDPEGTEVTSLPGLTRKASGSADNQVIGFDITTKIGVITIADNYEIVSTGTETQEWQIEVIFVNLDSDQNANTGKTFNANLIIQEDELPSTLADVCPEGGNFSDCIVKLYDERNREGANGLYYHDGTGSYINADQEAGDNSYRYSGGDYQVTEKAIGEGLTGVYTADATEIDGVINFYCNGSKNNVGGSCDVTQEYYYTTAYNETVHYNTLEETLNQAVSDGYLTNNNIKNFVCFGSDAETCPTDNLYRIIGVFGDQVKLIKYDYADTTLLGIDGDYYITYYSEDVIYSGKLKNPNTRYRYYWNYTNADLSLNDWESSRLNTVNLNINYWNYLTADWQEKIATTTWKVGGNTLANIGYVNVKTAYMNEIVSPVEATTYEDEIGLMYVSDYMYAVDPSGWTKLGYDNNAASNDYRSIKDDNWMFMGDNEWTITRRSDITAHTFSIFHEGNIVPNSVSGYDAVRPTFYLNSDVEITGSHIGTESDPYRIVV